jgi:hypothetical protein
MGILNVTSFSPNNADGFVAHLSGQNGANVCSHVYGDAAGVQESDFITVARNASGALLDNVAVGGAFTSTIKFGTLPALYTGTNPVGNPGLTAFYITDMKP